MARTTKRIQVSFSIPMYEVIERTAQLTGSTKSKVVSELVETCYDPMVRVLGLLEAATAAPQGVRDRLLETFVTLERDIETLSDVSSLELDRIFDDGQKSLDLGEELPPYTNRGVTFSNSLKNKGVEKSEKRGNNP